MSDTKKKKALFGKKDDKKEREKEKERDKKKPQLVSGGSSESLHAGTELKTQYAKLMDEHQQKKLKKPPTTNPGPLSAEKKRGLSGLFGKKQTIKLKEDVGVTSMDKRQKEQKKKMEQELAKKELEKQKRDKEMKSVLLTYLTEVLEEGQSSKTRVPRQQVQLELAPPLQPLQIH